jgi:hypothetical protein
MTDELIPRKVELAPPGWRPGDARFHRESRRNTMAPTWLPHGAMVEFVHDESPLALSGRYGRLITDDPPRNVDVARQRLVRKS